MATDSVSLRGSHFVLGQNPKNPFVTTAQQSFNNQAQERKQFPNIKQQSQEKAVNLQKGNLRASHFSLGDRQEQFYSTTSNAKFGFPKNPDQVKLNEEQKRQLRNHNFNMGSYGPATQTTNTLNYNQKPLQSNLQQDQLIQKAKMIGHHHDFKENKNLLMTTKYNDDFNRPFDEKDLHQGLAKSELKQKEIQLRNSHIVFGKEQVGFQTVQQKDYKEKDAKTRSVQKVDFQQTHFQMGVQKDEMCTTNDHFHQQQPLQNNSLPPEIEKDLRSHHFKLGEQGKSYTTEFKSRYPQQTGIDQEAQKINTAMLQQSHYKIGDQSVYPNNYQTANSQFLKAHEIKGNSQYDSHKDKASNFQFGQHKHQTQSEFHSRYQNAGSIENSKNKQLDSYLKASHFEFRDRPKESFQTTQKQDYQAAKNPEYAVLDANLKQDLRNHHFGHGQIKGQYQTQMQATHTYPINAQPGQLSEVTAKNLRTSHFKVQ